MCWGRIWGAGSTLWWLHEVWGLVVAVFVCLWGAARYAVRAVRPMRASRTFTACASVTATAADNSPPPPLPPPTHRRPEMQVAATPFPYDFDLPKTALVLIDMQRDFIEPGGFGETLGNDVSLLEAIVPATKKTLEAWRDAGGLVVHTREAHRPDLSDCPPAKRNRGQPSLRIGDQGPMGRILVAGEPGSAIVPECAPRDGEIVIDKPGKGAFYATGLSETLARRAI